MATGASDRVRRHTSCIFAAEIPADSRTHCALVFLARATKHCSPASAVERSGLNPYEFGAAVVSENRLQSNQLQCVHSPAAPHAYAERPHFPILLWDRYPPKRTSRITSSLQRRNRGGLCPGCFPDDLDDTGVFLPLLSVTRLTANALPLIE